MIDQATRMKMLESEFAKRTAAQEHEFAQAKQQIAEAVSENERLQESVAVLVRAINATRSSNSWRVTAPLRAIRKLLAGQRRTLLAGQRSEKVPAHDLSGAAPPIPESGSPVGDLLALTWSTRMRLGLNVYRAVRGDIDRRGLAGFMRRIPYYMTNRSYYVKKVSQQLRLEPIRSDYFQISRLPQVFGYQPLVSIVMPVFNVDPKWLLRAVSSVQGQTYSNWEICICDDGSTVAETVAALEFLENTEPKLRVERLPSNGGISAASNVALGLATGEFVALLDNDDELVPHALETCVAALNRDESIDILYSDEDKISFQGLMEEPFLKPDWSPSLLREVMYVGHLLFIRRTLVERVGGFDSKYDGVQDFELMLRLSELTGAIRHIPEILYHWRRIPGSIAERPDAKSGIEARQTAAVNAHLARKGIAATATANPVLPHRAVIKPAERDDFPRVSIIIPTKDAPEHISRCLDSLFGKTTYGNYEVVVVDNGTTDERAIEAISRHSVVHVPFREQFNYSRANNLGVARSSGEFVVFLNNDTEVLQGDWLEQMLFFFYEPDVGAVGPMLLYPDRTVQHAGVALGMRGTADHVLRGLPEDADGYFGSLACTREVSGVSFACVMTRKSDYLLVGGLSELYQTHYQDVDFCMRLREIGRRVLYTPRAKLIHYESATRGPYYDLMDRALLLDCWGTEIAAGDRYSRWIQQ